LKGLIIYFYLPFRNDNVRVILVIALTVINLLYGCSAEQVMVSSPEYENASCANLSTELGIAQERLQKLESIDTKERDARNFLLRACRFFVPLLAIINAALFLTDSYASFMRRLRLWATVTTIW
jgi:hypothetical protein